MKLNISLRLYRDFTRTPRGRESLIKFWYLLLGKSARYSYEPKSHNYEVADPLNINNYEQTKEMQKSYQ